MWALGNIRMLGDDLGVFSWDIDLFLLVGMSPLSAGSQDPV